MLFNTMIEKPIFNSELISRYDTAGPRYTSYPTAAQFHADFTNESYKKLAQQSNEDPVPSPLSLYIHIPFCRNICYYCACNKIITRDHSKTVDYLNNLYSEIQLHSELFDGDRCVSQLHWGGGTPTFLDHAQMSELMEVIRKSFNLLPDNEGDYSIEIDPRTVTPETIKLLRELGFNRISLGVQDFDHQVQLAVNRLQSEIQTHSAIDAARQIGFKSINLDLIYGLPFQTVDSFANTLDKVIDISPDRISVFNYAHLPETFKPQRRINVQDLPLANQKLEIMQCAVEKLSLANYTYIGMDHFAKPDDTLVLAQKSGNLHRNFQGYSTHRDCDLIGMGVSSISQIGNSYCQNQKNIDDYYNRCQSQQLPISRGVLLNKDDLLRRSIIMQLICHFELNVSEVEAEFNIDFWKYFADEYNDLRTMQDDGLLEINNNQISVLAAGRLLVRNICMVFDAYFREKKHNTGFSRVI